MKGDQKDAEQNALEQKALEIEGRLNDLEEQGLNSSESLAFLECYNEYKLGLLFLDRYDQGKLETSDTMEEKYHLEVGTVNIIINNIRQNLKDRGEDVTYFGAPRNADVGSAIGDIYQTFGGKDLYPGVERKAANLLYFLVKNHYFVDGNKRIAAFLFIWFLDMNGKLYVARDDPVLSYGLIYKFSVFVAKSDPKQKKLIVDLIYDIVCLPEEVPPNFEMAI